jgi:hypothetical protein
MTDTNVKSARREAIRRMAKASMGIGMGLQLAGAFVPAAQAVTPAQGARFGIIGQHVSAPAVGVKTGVTANHSLATDCYYSGYTNNGSTIAYRNGVC